MKTKYKVLRGFCRPQNKILLSLRSVSIWSPPIPCLTSSLPLPSSLTGLPKEGSTLGWTLPWPPALLHSVHLTFAVPCPLSVNFSQTLAFSPCLSPFQDTPLLVPAPCTGLCPDPPTHTCLLFSLVLSKEGLLKVRVHLQSPQPLAWRANVQWVRSTVGVAQGASKTPTREEFPTL